MNKDKFLKQLRDKLSILDEKEIDDIINEYESHIDQKIKDGKLETDAINGFGDIDELAKEILKSYKISSNYKSSTWLNYIEEFMRQMGDAIERFFKKISQEKNVDAVKAISVVLVGILLILLINIPIDIIYWLGKSLFSVGMAGSTAMVVTWSIIINIIRVLIIIAIIYGVWRNIDSDNSLYDTYKKHKDKWESDAMKEDYQKKYKDKWEKKYNEDLKKESKKEEVKIVKKEPISTGSMVLIIILKILLIFFSIPFICSLIGFIIGLALTIGLMLKGVFFIGVAIILVGMIIVNSAILDIIYKTIGGMR